MAVRLRVLPADGSGQYKEGASAIIEVTLNDDSLVPVPVPDTSLTTCVFTIFDDDSLAVLVASADCLNANGHTIDVNGLLTLNLSAAQMAIHDVRQDLEEHVAEITWTYPTSKTGKIEVAFPVKNLCLTT